MVVKLSRTRILFLHQKLKIDYFLGERYKRDFLVENESLYIGKSIAGWS